MEAVTYTKIRNNFAETMDKVCDDHAPIIVTRQSSQPVVVMSLEDYNAIEETIFLLRHPRNARRLRKAVRDIKNQRFTQHELIEA